MILTCRWTSSLPRCRDQPCPFFLNFEHRTEDGHWRDLYPDLRRKYAAGEIPKENPVRPRCPNLVRYEMMNHSAIS